VIHPLVQQKPWFSHPAEGSPLGPDRKDVAYTNNVEVIASQQSMIGAICGQSMILVGG